MRRLALFLFIIGSVIPLVPAAERPRRVLYNLDGDSCLSTKAGSRGPVAVNADDLRRLVEEVAFDGSRVDTVLICINAQVMYYPSKVGTMRGTLSSSSEREKWGPGEKQRFENIRQFLEKGEDPYAIILAETRKRGREALLSFRMNDDHGNDFLRTQFMVDHPDCLLGTEPYRGKGALDFGRIEVRDYLFRLIGEAVQRYECDGIELDFNRFPAFFKDGTTEERVAKMSSLVRQVRTLLDQIGSQRGRHLVLAVRAPSNYGQTPPTPETSRKLGCDVPEWVRQGWVDFVTVSEFLHEQGDLPIAPWKAAITGVPVFGGIECKKAGAEMNLTAAEYHRAAERLGTQGADGVYLFNFFTSRELGEKAYEPPFGVLRDLGTLPDLGARRELFVDRFLIGTMRNTSLLLHEPQPAPRMTEPADPMEYGTVIKDGGLFRLYTRDGRGAQFDGDAPEVTRYCESQDGIHWTKPNLGLIEQAGSRENNIILHEPPFCHNFSPMLDTRPGVPAAERYKALAGTVKSGLFAFQSPDGIHWSKLRPEAVITYTKEYAFDSQNVSFWSESEQRYVCYFRHFLDKRLRSVCRTTSLDYVTWTEPRPMKPNFPEEHLYTTLTHPYFRAPHLYIATPTRFFPTRGESTDILFMTARGDAPFDRTFRDVFIRPGLDPARWGNRSNYAALNVVPTSTTEMSIYVTPFRRFVLRTDGFASLHAGADPGEMVTRPFLFAGQALEINYRTSAAGSIRVELQDAAGKPLPDFSAADCPEIIGDEIAHFVKWKAASDLSRAAMGPVHLRFLLHEADLYSIKFGMALPDP